MKRNTMPYLFGLFLILSLQTTKAQGVSSNTIVAYIKTYADLAIREMKRTGVPASIKIAQGILETGAGNSDLVQRSNNHFGIKCKSSWTGDKVYHNDDEEGECFRKYESAELSYQDHSDYLASQPRYAFLFEYKEDDYSAWAWGLKKAGYATNPVYAQILIKYIETYSLNDLNKIARTDNEKELNAFYARLESQPVASSYLNTIAPETKKKAKSKKGRHRTMHVVKKGESLSSISRKYSVSVNAIKSSNKLKNDKLQVGQSIKIPKKNT
jgi:LysM repeat protein